MRYEEFGPEGPDDVVDTTALVNALRFAGWKGVPLRLELSDGTDLQINAPIIIGNDYVQFASELGFAPVRVPFRRIAAFELL
jgi:hypothetical protein